MTATKTQLTGGAFQDSEGNVLASGYLDFELSQDSSVTGVGNIASGITIRITLDVNGNVATSPSAQYVWANDVLLPVNSFYRVTGYTAAGQPSWGPNNQQVTSGGTGGGTFDLGTWVPNLVVSWTPPLQPVTFKTNGVANTNQVIENLISGSNISLTADGSGGTTIAATGIPSAISLKTNGVSNTSQTVENLIAGSNITLTADGAGGTTFDVTLPSLTTAGYILGGSLGGVLPIIGANGPVGNGTDNEVCVVQVVINTATTFSKLVASCSAAAGLACTFLAGLYTFAGARVLQASFNANSATVQAISITPVAVAPGTYWFAFGKTNNAPGFAIHTSSLLGQNMLNGGSTVIGTAANPIAAGSLPATLGSITVQSVGATQNIVAVKFMV